MFGIAPVILIAVLFSSKNPNAVLGTDGLKVKASFINKTWPLAALQRDSIRMLNLDENDGLKPRWRILGVSLPGLNSGLFKLRNGEKAHIYITQKQKVVYIPTQKGSILLSLEKPREFIDTLQGL